MRKRCVRIKTSVFNLIDNVNAIREDLAFDAGKFIAHNERFEAHTELSSQLATFGKEFKADISDIAFVELAIYYEIIIICHNFRFLRILTNCVVFD